MSTKRGNHECVGISTQRVHQKHGDLGVSVGHKATLFPVVGISQGGNHFSCAQFQHSSHEPERNTPLQDRGEHTTARHYHHCVPSLPPPPLTKNLKERGHIDHSSLIHICLYIHEWGRETQSRTQGKEGLVDVTRLLHCSSRGTRLLETFASRQVHKINLPVPIPDLVILRVHHLRVKIQGEDAVAATGVLIQRVPRHFAIS